jgi:hypothetical protein
MNQPVERRLAAILAADVAGYSRLMGEDEEGTHKRGSAAYRATAAEVWMPHHTALLARASRAHLRKIGSTPQVTAPRLGRNSGKFQTAVWDIVWWIETRALGMGRAG